MLQQSRFFLSEFAVFYRCLSGNLQVNDRFLLYNPSYDSKLGITGKLIFHFPRKGGYGMDQIRLLKKRKRKRRLKCVQSAATHHGIAAFFISTKYYSKKSYSPFFYRLRAELGYSASVLRRVRFFYVTYWKYMTCGSGRSPPFD